MIYSSKAKGSKSQADRFDLENLDYWRKTHFFELNSLASMDDYEINRFET